jgi:glycosyltransferase 2 family protein
VVPLLKRGLQYALSLLAMGALLYWAFNDVDLGQVWSKMSVLPLIWIAAIVLTTLSVLALRGWRWALLLRPFAPHVGLLDTSLALSICYAANVPIPRSGEVLRAVSLRWTRAVPIGSTLATVVVERILDVVWLVVFLGVSLLVVRGRLEEFIPGLGVLCLAALATCLAALAVLAAISIYRERAIAVLEPWLKRVSPKLASRAVDLLRTFMGGLQALHSPAAYLKIAVSSVLLELGYVLIIWEAFCAFGFVEKYGLGWDAALVIMVVSSMGVMIPTPGSAGSYHAFFAKPLLLLYAVNQSDALACATAVHAIATLTYVAIGLPAFLLQRATARRRSAAVTPESAQAGPLG